MTEPWWITVPKAFIVINIVMLFFAFTTWFERKLLGRMQLRYGPNRAGPKGLLVPIADLLKLIRKEAFASSAAKEPLYILAPVISMFTRSVRSASTASSSAAGPPSRSTRSSARCGPARNSFPTRCRSR